MLYRLFLLCGACFLFNTSGCQECDFFFAADNLPSLLVDWPQGNDRIRVGEDFFVGAEFPTMVNPDNTVYFSEGGGLVITQIFAYDANTDTITSARDAFEVVGTEGEILPQNVSNDASTAVLRFTCTGGVCRFQQRLRARRPGTYLVRVQGSAIDLITDNFEVCGQPSFRFTELVGRNNLIDFRIPGTLKYFGTQAGIFLLRSSDNDTFAITVE